MHTRKSSRLRPTPRDPLQTGPPEPRLGRLRLPQTAKIGADKLDRRTFDGRPRAVGRPPLDNPSLASSVSSLVMNFIETQTQ